MFPLLHTLSPKYGRNCEPHMFVISQQHYKQFTCVTCLSVHQRYVLMPTGRIAMRMDKVSTRTRMTLQSTCRAAIRHAMYSLALVASFLPRQYLGNRVLQVATGHRTIDGVLSSTITDALYTLLTRHTLIDMNAWIIK